MVAIPGAVVMAYKERESIFKTIIYVLAFSMLIYILWKIFKAFEKLGKVDDAIKDAISEVKENAERIMNDVKQKIDERITTTSEYHERIKKEKEEIPAKVEELAKKYNLSNEEKERLKESMLREVEIKEQQPYFYAYHGGAVDYKKMLEKEREKQKKILEKKKEVKPTYKTVKEHMELEGKRWEAKADYYSRKLHLIEGLDSNRYYKLTWIDNKGLRHERIMKGSEIKAMKGDVYKVISILPMPATYKPKSTPLPIRIKPIMDKNTRYILPVERPIRAI